VHRDPANLPTPKRESWLAIGKHRVRIPSDLHFDLMQFSDARHYDRAFNALLYCASVGLKVLGHGERLHVINVDTRDER